MPRHSWRIVGLLAALGALAACGSGAKAAPSWVPQPSVSLEASPNESAPAEPPQPNGPNGSGVPLPNPPGGSSGSPGSGPDSAVVATGLSAPTGLVILPDGSALVGERTTGRIVQVQPKPGQPVPTVRTIRGLSTSGDGGLLDLALSPTYSEDGLIYAYVTTPTDNRVIDFTLNGPEANVVTGIPRGATSNTGRLMFDTSGLLYIGTGDAGSPQLAANPKSLAGKVLRVDSIGHAAAGNPSPGSPVYTRGERTVDGLCSSSALNLVYATEAPGSVDLLEPGADYSSRPRVPAATLPPGRTGAGGCAVIANQLVIATSDGNALLAATISPRDPVGKFSVALDKRYGRLRTVVAAPDGALWLTTTNKDGHGHPTPADERVIRLDSVPASGGNSPA